MTRGYLQGSWNAICDVCGRKYKAHQLRERWDGAMVCADDFEVRNPQDFLRIRAEKTVPPWTQPEPQYVFLIYGLLYEDGSSLLLQEDGTTLLEIELNYA